MLAEVHARITTVSVTSMSYIPGLVLTVRACHQSFVRGVLITFSHSQILRESIRLKKASNNKRLSHFLNYCMHLITRGDLLTPSAIAILFSKLFDCRLLLPCCLREASRRSAGRFVVVIDFRTFVRKQRTAEL